MATEVQAQAAVDETGELISRLKADPLSAEIESATERYHEVPYSRLVGDHTETGYIDLLFHNDSGWHIVDFKTDAIYSDAHRDELVAVYASQMRRYAGAIETLLGETARVRICFLDDMGKGAVVEV